MNSSETTTTAEPMAPVPAPISRRKIADHKLNDLNAAITVLALGERNIGGANNLYQVSVDAPGKPSWRIDLPFQSGNPAVEINGISNEALLAVVIDRLSGFQSGPFPDKFNAVALIHAKSALDQLHLRTRDRMARDVQGQPVK